MNRILIYIFSLICVCTACTKTEGIPSREEIRLGVKNSSFSARASVNDLTQLSAVGDQVGVFGVLTENYSPSVILTDEWNAPLLLNNIRTTAIDPQTGSINWAGNYFYPNDNQQYVKFCAYYPYAPASGAGNFIQQLPDQAPLLRFTITGAEDIMYATPVNGSVSVDPGVLSFNHVLTQFHFRLMDEQGTFQNTRITRLAFENVNTSSSMNIETGRLGEWTTPVSSLAFDTNYPVTVTSAPGSHQVLTGEIMLQPGMSEYRVTMETDNRGTFTGIVIKPTGENIFRVGKSYMITLILRATAIGITASVTPWEWGGTGEGIVQ